MKMTHDEIRAEAQGEGLQTLDTQGTSYIMQPPTFHNPEAKVLSFTTVLTTEEIETIGNHKDLKDLLLDRATNELARELVATQEYISVDTELDPQALCNRFTHTLRVLPCNQKA